MICPMISLPGASIDCLENKCAWWRYSSCAIIDLPDAIQAVADNLVDIETPLTGQTTLAPERKET